MRHAIEARDNLLISGGTGTGKTTLLNALAAFLPADDRLVLIEDTAELQLDAPNLVRFEARREQTGLPAVSIRDLLRATLRHRPDRILVGEVRGGEAFDLLQALNTGPLGHAVDHSRELGGAGAQSVCLLRAAVRRRLAVRGHPPRHRGVPPGAGASRTASRAARGEPDGAGVRVRLGRRCDVPPTPTQRLLSGVDPDDMGSTTS